MSRKLVPAMEVELTPGGSLRVNDGGEGRVLLEHTPEGRNLQVCRRPVTPEVVVPSGSGPKKSRRSLQLLRDDDICRALELSDGSSEEETDEELDPPTLRRLLREDLVDDGCEGMDGDVVEEERVEGQQESYLRAPGPTVAIQDPTELFMAVWDESIMTEIVRQTNEYAWQRIAPIFEVEAELPEPLSTWSDVTTDEMYRYFAILICMSMCNRAVMSDYWTTGVMGMPDFRRLMSRNRFFLISRFLHFVDNDTCMDYSLSSYDKKIIKIRPILDHCNERFAALYVPYQHLSLDESLLLWKGRLSWVQCIRTKAARFGIKTYELCEAETGYLLRCLIYAGKDSTMRQEPIHGFENCTAKVVLELMDGFLDAGHCLVMDNWYNQLSLTRYLKSRKTDVIGTMNPRRVHVPDDIKQANPRMQRGGQIARHCGDICLIAWKDVKLVTAVSTFHNDSRVLSRRAGAQIIKPRMIADYNRYMGGVDSKDQQLSMYLMERKRGMKWYIKVFKRLLNTSLLNTYIIHKKTPVAAKPLTHRQFRMEVALGLLEKFPRAETGRNIRSNDAETPRRLMKGVDHFVLNTPTIGTGNRKTQKRCVRCLAANRRTMVTLICSFCNVALCAGTCWVEYHTLRTL